MNETELAPPSLSGALVETSPMRQAVARRMTTSKREVPHFYVETEVPMGAVARLVAAQPVDESAPRITVTAVLARACAVALTLHPRLNAVWTERGLEQIDGVNLGVAVALEGGLVAPALLGAETRSLPEVAVALTDLIERARVRKLRPREMSEATFTLSNLGMFDVSRFTAIVVPPQVAILAAGRTIDRPVVIDGEITPQPVMTATVSADHRAVDGADVAAFLAAFKALLAQPTQLDVSISVP